MLGCCVPSYGGRIPSVVTDMFRNVKADGTKAILAAVFGNRAIDDTLLELQDVLEASGFVCIAGMEAVAEHSLMHQFGTGRPDQQDEKELLEFAAKILQNSETQRTPCIFGETDHIENIMVFRSNLLQMENVLPAVCAQKNARQVPFR